MPPAPPLFVCRLLYKGTFVGTGFSIGPRLLLTCYHVGAEFERDWGQAQAEFGDRETGNGSESRPVAIEDCLSDQARDIAVLVTSTDLPCTGVSLVAPYGERELERILAKGARVSGHSGIDQGKDRRQHTIAKLMGSAETAGGWVSSFQVAGGIHAGMSGSPCLMDMEEGWMVFALVQTGGKLAGNTRLVSSGVILDFLGEKGFGSSHYQVWNAHDLPGDEPPPPTALSAKDERLARALRILKDLRNSR